MTQKIVRFQQWRGAFRRSGDEQLYFYDWTQNAILSGKHPYDNTAVRIWNEEQTEMIAADHNFVWFEEFTQEFEIP